jgi:hypothetical protein
MGYANAIRFSLAKGQSLAAGLLPFNLGLEIGQIFVVLLILLMGYLVTNIPGVTRVRWVKAVSLIVLALALGMVWERIPF